MLDVEVGGSQSKIEVGGGRWRLKVVSKIENEKNPELKGGRHV